eukprot:6411125-Pyramimonas_sp.AAC.1
MGKDQGAGANMGRACSKRNYAASIYCLSLTCISFDSRFDVSRSARLLKYLLPPRIRPWDDVDLPGSTTPICLYPPICLGLVSCSRFFASSERKMDGPTLIRKTRNTVPKNTRGSHLRGAGAMCNECANGCPTVERNSAYCILCAGAKSQVEKFFTIDLPFQSSWVGAVERDLSSELSIHQAKP